MMWRRLHVLRGRGRGREARMHVGAIGAGRTGNGDVRWIRAIYWNTRMGVAGNEGRVIRRSGRGWVWVLLEVWVVKIGGRV